MRTFDTDFMYSDNETITCQWLHIALLIITTAIVLLIFLFGASDGVRRYKQSCELISDHYGNNKHLECRP